MLMVMNNRKRSYSWEKNRSSPNWEILHLVRNWKFLTKITVSYHSVFIESVKIIMITKVVAVAVVVIVIITRMGIVNSVYISHVIIVRFVHSDYQISHCHVDKKHSLRTAFFWVIMQRVVIITYRRFVTTYRFHSQVKHEDGTDRLYRNFGKKLPLLAAL
jgi:hypothetical protein